MKNKKQNTDYLKQIVSEINSIVIETDIRNQKDYEEFLKKEKIGKIYTDDFIQIMKKLAAKNEPINIDLKSLDDRSRAKARYILDKIDFERKMIKNDGYYFSKTYLLIKLIVGLLGILGGLGGILGMFDGKNDDTLRKQKKFKQKLRAKVSKAPSAKKDSPKEIFNWASDIFDLIKNTIQ